MFVLFEGLDLSGKSTLCRELSKVLDWPVRHNTLLEAGASPMYEAARQAHLTQSATEAEIGWLFLHALESEIESFRPDSAPCIQDSTILLRSIAYHSGLGNATLADAFTKLLPRHPKPVLAFLCRPGVEVRLRRLEGRVARGNDTPEDFVVRDNPAMFAHMEDTLAGLAATHLQIEILDTSHLENLEARAALIRGLVERLRPLESRV